MEVAPANSRMDRGGLAAPLSAKIFEGRVARTHSPDDPLTYASGPEHRDLSELESIVAQLPGTKVTLLHPSGMLRDGTEAHVIGIVTGARVDGEHAVATILIHDAEALDAIANGIVELSLGYQCHLDENRYQRSVSLDHLALVPAARCGETCALRTDCANSAATCAPCKSRAISYTFEVPVITEKEKIQMDELQTQLAAALADAASHKLRADTAVAELADATARITEIETKSKIDADNAAADLAKAIAVTATEKLRADAADAAVAAEKLRADAAESDHVNARVQARVEVLTAAKSVGVEIENLDKASDRDIKAAIVKHVDGIEIAADAVAAYVDGMYAGSMRRFDTAVASRVEVLTTIETNRQDGAPLGNDSQKVEEAARAASASRRKTAWNRKKTQE